MKYQRYDETNIQYTTIDSTESHLVSDSADTKAPKQDKDDADP